ncbi:MAG: cyclophilin-like fold protein [Burkholderiaceae bacterium]
MLALLDGSFVGLAACAPGSSVAQTPADAARSPSKDSAMKIRLIVGEQVATATLYDNATTKDFASLLPLSRIERVEP